MDAVTGKILGVSAKTGYFLENLQYHAKPILMIDILIVAILLYWVFIFLKETRAMRILYGLLFLLGLLAIGQLLNLILLNWILKSLMTMLIVAIPVVFQPELRSALERIGRTKFIGEGAFFKEDFTNIINEILTAIIIFSKQKTGALIVFKREVGLKEYIDNGIAIEAKISSEILMSIFFPKSPLHDGAVIIMGDKIVSAGSILPVSQTISNNKLGTRHKAAIGITENSDAVAVVVSEETGAISIAVGGKLDYKISEERLKNRLSSLLKQNNKK